MMASLTLSPALTRSRPCSASGQRQPAFRGPVKACSRAAIRCEASGQTTQGRTEVPSTSARRDVILALSSLAAAAATWSPAEAQECELNTSADGIQYCELKEGSGDVPVKGALIRCHYVGKLASNNRVFDSSYERGRPLTFKIGVREVIAGWDEGILGGEGISPMKEGGKRRLIIPPGLAYGERGAGGGIIPPNSTLVFDVELLPRRR